MVNKCYGGHYSWLAFATNRSSYSAVTTKNTQFPRSFCALQMQKADHVISLKESGPAKMPESPYLWSLSRFQFCQLSGSSFNRGCSPEQLILSNDIWIFRVNPFSAWYKQEDKVINVIAYRAFKQRVRQPCFRIEIGWAMSGLKH